MRNNEYFMQIFHEIKNSVTLINSYLQLIEKTCPDIAQSNYWVSSRAETARLKAITTEVSQMKFGSHLHLERIDLRDFLSDCCRSFLYSTGIEEVYCHCTLTLSQNPLVILADARQLRHAIINLLKNSSEAMNQHGEIHVEAQETANQVLIRITDSGCGIAPDILDHIFEPFITTKEDGSGLGLNITSEIITAHGGSIHVDSTLGCGSVFTIALPDASP